MKPCDESIVQLGRAITELFDRALADTATRLAALGVARELVVSREALRAEAAIRHSIVRPEDLMTRAPGSEV